MSDLRLYLFNNWLTGLPSRRLRRLVLRQLMGFGISGTTSVQMGCRFDQAGGLKIGANSTLGRGCRIDTRGGVAIGRNCSVSEDVVILTADHDIQARDFAGRIRRVRLDDHVFVGTRATILPGCHLGTGSVLATGAVLTRDIPPFEIWGGVPAQRIGARKQDLDYQTYYPRFLH